MVKDLALEHLEQKWNFISLARGNPPGTVYSVKFKVGNPIKLSDLIRVKFKLVIYVITITRLVSVEMLHHAWLRKNARGIQES